MSGAYSTSKLFTKTTVYLVHSNVGIATKKNSTTFAALSFVDTIRCNIDQGFMTGAGFVDLHKAFDTIEHFKLLPSVVPGLILYT